MRRFTNTRALYLLLSLALATVMWFYVATGQNPVVERSLTVDLHIRGLGANQVVIQAPSRVQVRLQGPRSALTLLSPALLDASVDLSGLRPGEHRVPVYVGTPPEVRVVERTPADALVVLDVLASRRLPVEVSLIGTPPEGVTMGTPRASPSFIIVSGAASQVEGVRHALVSLDTTNLHQNAVLSLPVHLVDVGGHEMRGLRVDPSIVEARLPVREGVITKIVPVIPTIVGTPAPTLAITGTAADPATVALTGQATILQGIQVAPTAPVDIARARGDVTRQVALQLPPGATPAVQRVTVVVHVGRALLSTILRAVPVKVTGVPARAVSRVVPDRVDVQVEGPEDLLQRLTPQAVAVEVNAAGKAAGEHRLALRAILPRGIRLLEIRPSQILLILRAS